MTLADLTRERLCVPELRGRDATAVLLELSLAFAEAGVVADSLSLFNTTLNDHFLSDRDVLGSVAYPVCRVNSLESPVFALGRNLDAIRWREGAPAVHLVFLIAAPRLQSRRLARLVTSITDLAHDAAAVAQLLESETPAELLESLRPVALPGGEPLTPGLLT